MKYFAILLLTSVAIAACGKTEGGNDASAKAHEDSLKANVRAVYDIMSTGDLNELDKYMAADAVDHQMMPGYPAGLEGIKKFMTEWRAAYSDMKFTVDNMIVDGDNVAVLFTWSGTNTGDFMGMKATNKGVNVQGVDWMRMQNGKMVEHWGFMEETKMMMQLGLMPEMPGTPPAPEGATPDSSAAPATPPTDTTKKK